MAILNYTTKKPAASTVGEIMAMLSKFGVRNISLEYDPEGNPAAVTFTYLAGTLPLMFRLEENTPGVLAALKKASIETKYKNEKHARDVAWRIKKDFIEAQLALVEAGIANLPELFIGDLVVDSNSNERLIERFAKNDGRLYLSK